MGYPPDVSVLRRVDLVEQDLRIEICDQKPDRLADLDVPVLGDDHRLVGALHADVDQRHYVLTFGSEAHVAHSCEVEGRGDPWQDRKILRFVELPAPRKRRRNEKFEILSQPVGEAGDFASRAAAIEGFYDRLSVLCCLHRFRFPSYGCLVSLTPRVGISDSAAHLLLERISSLTGPIVCTKPSESLHRRDRLWPSAECGLSVLYFY